MKDNIRLKNMVKILECPRCCGRGYTMDGSGNFTHSTGTCPECKGVRKVKNVCHYCGKQITHNEGAFACTIKCFCALNVLKLTPLVKDPQVIWKLVKDDE